MNTDAQGQTPFRWRRILVQGVFLLALGALVVRAVDLQVGQREFLRGEGDARHLRVVPVPAHRGMILDRNGEPLAVSTPVDSVWANPGEVLAAPEYLDALARVLEMKAPDLRARFEGREGRGFVWLRRHVMPEVADRLRALDAPGVYLQREYRRYYPPGEVTAHILGYTNIDDRGQEGLELAFEEWLTGTPGARRVLRDRLGRVIRDVESISPARPGRDLTLSVDQRIQYLAYRELKAAVLATGARGGSVVVLDPRTGEVIAMVNQPSFNPNNRGNLRSETSRNRAVTDVFEPGSSLKPFTVAAALESGRFTAETQLDTAPGHFRVGNHTVRDVNNYGRIDLTTLLSKSSNIGAAKLALALPPKEIWGVLQTAGFGQTTGSGFPGEAGGHLGNWSRWSEVERATLSFGYGISVTPLQLAQAYGALATDGRVVTPTFVKVSAAADGQRVMSEATVRQVRRMLEAVTVTGGTGTRAAVDGYRVAGKTGTSRKSIRGGYSDERFMAVFAGLAPASDPRLVMVVVIDEPTGGDYYGGQIAAPVFGKVMAGALRLLNVAPDGLPEIRAVSLPGQNGKART